MDLEYAEHVSGTLQHVETVCIYTYVHIYVELCILHMYTPLYM